MRFSASHWQQRDFFEIFLRMKNYIRGVSAQLFLLLNVCLFLVLLVLQLYPQKYLSTDFSSFVVHVDSWHSSKLTYSEYFDIKPPGLQILLIAWSYVFGSSMYSWIILYLACGTVIAYSLLTFLKFVVKPNHLLLAMLYWTILFGMFGEIGRNFLSPEFIGITFLSLALLVIIQRKSILHIFLASCLVFYSGSIKEVFILSPLLFFPLLNGSYAFRRFISMALGGLSVYFLLFAFLEISNQTSAYFEILSFKSRLFKVGLSEFFSDNLATVFDFLLRDSAILALTLVFLAFAMFSSGHLSKLASSNTGISLKILGWMILGIILGLALQNKDASGHYLLAVSPFIFTFLIVLIANLPIPRKNLTLGLILTITCLINAGDINSRLKIQNPGDYWRWASTIESAESIARFNVPRASCMQVVYGWDAGSFYHYSHNPPCSKFFLINLILKDPSSMKLYKSDMISTPPPLVVYQTKLADLNYSEFEAQELNWAQVLQHCYRQLTGTVYKREGTLQTARRCVSSNS